MLYALSNREAIHRALEEDFNYGGLSAFTGTENLLIALKASSDIPGRTICPKAVERRFRSMQCESMGGR